MPRLIVALLALGLPTFSEAACCYFAAKDKDISQPGQKAFIVWHPEESIEAFTVQPKFEGNALDFGMVIPTPSRPKLDEMPRDFFHDLAIYTILMPLPESIWVDLRPSRRYRAEEGMLMSSASADMSVQKNKVTVLEAGVVGSLDYKILLAEEAAGLYDWLRENQYSYSGDEATLDHYIQKKWVFTVMKIDPKQMKRSSNGSYLGEVTPTRFTFETPECVYPLRITKISVPDRTDALFYVQAPEPMDLAGDWSWLHSFRVMFLTYALGCSMDERQQAELNERNQWLAAKKARDPAFETTKLEWLRRLTAEDMAVLESPLRNYPQMGGGDLPPGASFIPLEQLLKEVEAEYRKDTWFWERDHDYARQQLDGLRSRYAPDKGRIVKVARIGGFTPTKWMWYPNREAPPEEVSGLTRLQGHLQQGQWLTKFRKQIRRDEMDQDLVLSPVPETLRQEYVRILLTSPP